MVLERGVLTDAEGVSSVPGDCLLAEDVLGAVDDTSFAHALEGVNPFGGLLSHNNDPAEGSASQHVALNELKLGSWVCGLCEGLDLVQVPAGLDDLVLDTEGHERGRVGTLGKDQYFMPCSVEDIRHYKTHVAPHQPSIRSGSINHQGRAKEMRHQSSDTGGGRRQDKNGKITVLG